MRRLGPLVIYNEDGQKSFSPLVGTRPKKKGGKLPSCFAKRINERASLCKSLLSRFRNMGKSICLLHERML